MKLNNLVLDIRTIFFGFSPSDADLFSQLPLLIFTKGAILVEGTVNTTLLIALLNRKKLWTSQVSSSKTSCPFPLSTRKKKLWVLPLSSIGKMESHSMSRMNKLLK